MTKKELYGMMVNSFLSYLVWRLLVYRWLKKFRIYKVTPEVIWCARRQMQKMPVQKLAGFLFLAVWWKFKNLPDAWPWLVHEIIWWLRGYLVHVYKQRRRRKSSLKKGFRHKIAKKYQLYKQLNTLFAYKINVFNWYKKCLFYKKFFIFFFNFSRLRKLKKSLGVNFMFQNNLNYVVWQMRFANTIASANVYIHKGLILVNNKVVQNPLFKVQVGDVIKYRLTGCGLDGNMGISKNNYLLLQGILKRFQNFQPAKRRKSSYFRYFFWMKIVYKMNYIFWIRSWKKRVNTRISRITSQKVLSFFHQKKLLHLKTIVFYKMLWLYLNKKKQIRRIDLNNKVPSHFYINKTIPAGIVLFWPKEIPSYITLYRRYFEIKKLWVQEPSLKIFQTWYFYVCRFGLQPHKYKYKIKNQIQKLKYNLLFKKFLQSNPVYRLNSVSKQNPRKRYRYGSKSALEWKLKMKSRPWMLAKRQKYLLSLLKNLPKKQVWNASASPTTTLGVSWSYFKYLKYSYNSKMW